MIQSSSVVNPKAKMRIYSSNPQRVVGINDFPTVFAVCTTIHPCPKFQIVHGEDISNRGFVMSTVDNTSALQHVYLRTKVSNDYIYGTFEICQKRVRFENRNWFLKSRQQRVPVLFLDLPSALPLTNEPLIVPINARINTTHHGTDPYTILNYLLQYVESTEDYFCEPIFTEEKPLPQLRSTTRPLIDKAIRDGATCPISMNPIQLATAYITPCNHVFELASIEQWLTTNSTCPCCREEIA
jgi:hypothetical protein